MSSWFLALQRALPQHGLSRAMGRLGQSQTPWIKNTFINQFARAYNISLDEAQQQSFAEFACFNDFFTRALQEDARPIAQAQGAIVSPADGVISQMGSITDNQLLQAKGHKYSINSLARSLDQGFNNGEFCTIYLAPSDYHRVHLPLSGTLTDTLAVPGELFSVNGTTDAGISGLFCRNERLVCRFATSQGPMLVILVGALIVASIQTDWLGPESPYVHEEHNTHQLQYSTGDEIGRFLLGSTVICCFPKGVMQWKNGLTTGARVKMGQQIGELTNA